MAVPLPLPTVVPLPSQPPTARPLQDIRAAQRSCRKMLNVLLSFAYVLDAPDIPHLRLLTPHTKEVQVRLGPGRRERC